MATSWFGAPVVLLSLIGAVQRLLALRRAEALLPADTGGGTVEFRRARMVAKAELAVGGVAILCCLVLPAAPLGEVARLAVVCGFLGTSALGAIAGAMLAGGVFSRLAVEVARPPALFHVILGAVGALVLGQMASAASAMVPAAGSIAVLLWLAGWAAWAVGCVMLAHQCSSIGDEVAAPPRRRRAAAPEAAAAPASPAARASQRAAKRALEDDSPIPLD